MASLEQEFWIRNTDEHMIITDYERNKAATGSTGGKFCITPTNITLQDESER